MPACREVEMSLSFFASPEKLQVAEPFQRLAEVRSVFEAPPFEQFRIKKEGETCEATRHFIKKGFYSS